ncbi:MAG: hypothetical protein K2W82_16975 [Candidatus Obscuribacterales bacterium]|nr:hypothetical protein [Candidatus Obscuribacterales bacterium]
MTKTNSPLVAGDKRGCLFFVQSSGQAAPAAFTGLVNTPGAAREVIRIAGGCKGLPAEFQTGMMRYFQEAFRLVDADGNTTREYTGTVFSGGTANADESGDLKNDMVTNAPAYLAAIYRCIAISTTPRTAHMALDRRAGGVVVDDYGGRIDHRQHGALVTQPSVLDEVFDWDGDLDLYLGMMEGWQQAGFKTGVLVLNGGDVSRREIYKALKLGLPVIVIEGSGREADAFVKAYRDGDFSLTGAETRAKLVSKQKSTADIDAEVEQCKVDLAEIDRSLVTLVPLSFANATSDGGKPVVWDEETLLRDAKVLREALVARGFLAAA